MGKRLRLYLKDYLGESFFVLVIIANLVIAASPFFLSRDTALSLVSVMWVTATASACFAFKHFHDQRKRLEYSSNFDSLTGLVNRFYFNRLAENRLLEATVSGQSITILLMDLDRFKQVNDTLGHPAGDHLLQKVAQRLQACLRTTDVIARFGGDEFPVLISGNVAHQFICRKIQEAFQAPFLLNLHSVEVGISIGVSQSPAHGKSPVDLIRHADTAMYIAKREHLGYYLYSKDSDPNTLDAITLLGDFRQALLRKEFFLEYQPKVSLVNGALLGVEALIRWRHPKLGILHPDKFLPLAEQSELVRPMTNWVLDQAIPALAHWRAMGLDVPALSLNVSPYAISEGSILTRATKLLDAEGLSFGDLYLEVSESAIKQHPDTITKIILCLDILEISLSIDDFGMGHSSLLQIKHLPIKEIKIDSVFINAMLSSKRDYSIVKSSVQLAHELGCTVCAEGVESLEVENSLRDMGCDSAQGYYIASPMEEAHLLEFIKSRNNG